MSVVCTLNENPLGFQFLDDWLYFHCFNEIAWKHTVPETNVCNAKPSNISIFLQ